jgi:hypothetical protein
MKATQHKWISEGKITVLRKWLGIDRLSFREGQQAIKYPPGINTLFG